MSKDENLDEVFDVLNGYTSLKHIEIDENDNTSALMRNFKVPGLSNNDSSQNLQLSHGNDKSKYDEFLFMQSKTNKKSASKCFAIHEKSNRNWNNDEKDHI